MLYCTLFTTFFLAEMRGAFDMSCMAPVEVLLVLDLMSIPEANTNWITYVQDFINVVFEFYGNSEETSMKDAPN